MTVSRQGVRIRPRTRPGRGPAEADRLARAAFLGGFNRVAGLAFGLVKGAALLGFVLMALERFLPSPSFAELVGSSKLAHPLTTFAANLLDAGRGLAGPEPRREHA